MRACVCVCWRLCGLFPAGFPSVSRNREAYQSIDQQDESTSPANPFNQAQDAKQPGRTYWADQAVNSRGVSPLGFFYFLLCYAAVRCWGAILTMYSYVLYSWSLLEQIEYFYFGKSLTMENGTNKKKKRTTLIFFFKGGDVICWGGTSLLNKSRGGPPPPRCAPVVFLLFLRLLFLVERCWMNYCVCSSFVSLLFCPSVSFFCKLLHFFACSNYFPISLWLYGTAVLEAQDSFVVLFFLFFFYSRGHKWWWWWWW